MSFDSRTLAGVAAAAIAAACVVGCSKSTDDPSQHAPVQIGFVPPPATASSATAAPTSDNAPAPTFKSFFAETPDSSVAPATSTVVTTRTVANAVDPDDTASAAIRARANACFPLAGLARGASRSVTLSFIVLATGRVSRSDVSGASSTNDGAFYSCLRNVADSASFPEKADAGTDTRSISVTASATAS